MQPRMSSGASADRAAKVRHEETATGLVLGRGAFMSPPPQGYESHADPRGSTLWQSQAQHSAGRNSAA